MKKQSIVDYFYEKGKDELTHEDLEKDLKVVLGLKEFSSTEELGIMKLPSQEVDGKTALIVTRIIDKKSDIKFKKKVYLYSLSKPMEEYDLKELDKPGVHISPTCYNQDFNPNKKITCTFNPEILQDFVASKDSPTEEKVNEFKEKLVKDFENKLFEMDGFEATLPVLKNKVFLRYYETD